MKTKLIKEKIKVGFKLKDGRTIKFPATRIKRVKVKIKQEKDRWINIMNKKSWSQLFREQWLADGIELVDITKLCEAKIDCHGCCNDINSPEENIYHIKIVYRGDMMHGIVAQYSGGKGFEVIDDDKYCIFVDKDDQDNGFIVFRKVKVKKDGKM